MLAYAQGEEYEVTQFTHLGAALAYVLTRRSGVTSPAASASAARELDLSRRPTRPRIRRRRRVAPRGRARRRQRGLRARGADDARLRAGRGVRGHALHEPGGRAGLRPDATKRSNVAGGLCLSRP